MNNEPIEPPITAENPLTAVRHWFTLLGRYCAAVDYKSAHAIFAPDVVSFGTKADIVSGIEALEANQWRGIWPNIEDFRFDLDGLHADGNESLAWGVATWASTGFTEEGETFSRPGRATVVLERREGIWLAAHTHFSLNPGTPPGTFGRRRG